MKVATAILLAHVIGVHPQNTSNNPKIEWSTCEALPKSEQSAFQCATLAVPRDYQKAASSNNTLQLNLLKFPAQKQPAKGSVLFNPGGPGYSGRSTLVAGSGSLASIVSAYTGFEYDVVTWDPRGTGVTIPAVCYASAAERQLAQDRLPYITESNFDTSATTGWGVLGSVAETCKAALEGTGDLLGSACVARDMVNIIDALGEDGLLRYYGASYGTALGMIFAAMYPDKVESMVLDGVLNPHQYIAGLDYQQLASTDAVFDGFLSACLSRPTLCPLAKRDISIKNLKQQFDEALEDLDNNPFSYGPETAEFISASWVNQIVLEDLYDPTTWTSLATLLDAVISRDSKAVAEAMSSSAATNSTKPFNDQSQVESIAAIRCSDVGLRASNVSEVLPVAKAILDQSPQLASYLLVSQPLICPQWPFTAKERYAGNFDVQTKNSILFVGNVFDPITSLDGAVNATATFNGSRLLVHEGYGHTSMKQLSKCTIDAVAAYFASGKLPEVGMVCRIDVPIFATSEELAAPAKALLVPSA